MSEMEDDDHKSQSAFLLLILLLVIVTTSPCYFVPSYRSGTSSLVARTEKPCLLLQRNSRKSCLVLRKISSIYITLTSKTEREPCLAELG